VNRKKVQRLWREEGLRVPPKRRKRQRLGDSTTPCERLRSRFGGAGASYIEPGSPWENPWVESYGSRMRDELLAIEQFDTLLEAQVLIADWRIEYNTYRPHSALGMLTPAVFANQWRRTNPPNLS
jgi:transposase InsO family protein